MKKVIRTVLKITLTTVVLICALAFPHMNALAWDGKTVDVVKVDDTHYTVSCRIPYSEAHVTEQNSYLSIYQFTILSGYKTIVDSSDMTNYLTHLDGSHHIELSQNDGTGIVIVFLSVAQDYSYHIPVGTYTKDYWCFNSNIIKSIASRTSGNVTVDFWYDKMHYKMTIPAGTDFSRYLTGPGNGFIGFMKIYSLVGGSLIETAD